MPGFLAYQAIDAGVDRAGEGTVFAVTVCSDREAADRSVQVAAGFVRDELGDACPSSILRARRSVTEAPAPAQMRARS
jgi:hypothetical protein